MSFIVNASKNSGAGLAGFYSMFVCRIGQFAMGLTCCGIYAHYVDLAKNNNDPVDSHLVYGVVVGSMSAFGAFIYIATPQIFRQYILFALDVLLSFLYLVLFGIFGKELISFPNPEGDKDVSTLKSSVWVDLCNMILWAITASYGALIFFRERRKRRHQPGDDKVEG